MTEKFEEAIKLCESIEADSANSYNYREFAEDMLKCCKREEEIMEHMAEKLSETVNMYFKNRAEDTDKEYEANAFENLSFKCNVSSSGLSAVVRYSSDENYETYHLNKESAYLDDYDYADISDFIEKAIDLSLDEYRNKAMDGLGTECKEAQKDLKEKDVYNAIEVCKDIRQAINPELSEAKNTTNYYEARMEDYIERENMSLETLKSEFPFLEAREPQVVAVETLERMIENDIRNYEEQNADIGYKSPVAVIGFEKTEDGMALALYNVDETAEYQVTDGEGMKAVLDSAIEADKEKSAERTVEEQEIELD